MRRLLLAAVLATAAAAGLTGCAASDEISKATSCLVTDTGSKLCGADAAAWCEMPSRPTDSSTVEACQTVGVDLTEEAAADVQAGIDARNEAGREASEAMDQLAALCDQADMQGLDIPECS